MRHIYRLTKKYSGKFCPEKQALLLHTFVWFLLGMTVAAIGGGIKGLQWEEMRTAVMSAASFFALFLGYAGGILWLVNGK